MSSGLLRVKQIECRYDDNVIVQDLSFHINPGTMSCLLGPSGCGKTTVLRSIAGFEPIYRGEIIIDDQVISSPTKTLSPEKRGLGMVFQDYALFPHMNVIDNITFSQKKQSKHDRKKIANDLLALVGLKDMGSRYPHELSGGQQQRVALARALASKPKLILMDEPFSNLDIELRERLGLEVREILKEQGIASILVTHDQQEAFALGETIGIMKEGKLLQWDTPFNLYHEPIDRFVAEFIGQGIFIEGTLSAPDTVHTEIGTIKGDRAYPWPIGSSVDVLLRPDDIVPNQTSSLSAKVVAKAFKGASILYTLQLPTGKRLLSLFPSHQDHCNGEYVSIKIAADHLITFKKEE